MCSLFDSVHVSKEEEPTRVPVMGKEQSTRVQNYCRPVSKLLKQATLSLNHATLTLNKLKHTIFNSTLNFLLTRSFREIFKNYIKITRVLCHL